ncbi:MAG: CotS family spore coat protein [Clostridia bacterium]|nr:CotS family spore coat protein [Clostridia bacterium]
MEKAASNANEDLIKLSQEVLEFYNIKPDSISVIQGGSIKTVWKVMTGNGPVCLKRLKQTYDKAQFSVNAQIYIRNSGGKVPSILLAKDGQPIVQYNGQLFVLYEWLEGRSLDFTVRDDLVPSIQGLAAFHIASKGYVPPDNARVSSKLAKWPDQYASMKNRMLEWKEISRKNTTSPDHSAYLKHIDAIIDIADLALYLLGKSSYAKLTSPGSSSIVLCHQDFGRGNALLTNHGVYVLDLDGVTYDLPARDLRKIIGKRAEGRNLWDKADINEVVKAYTEVHSLSREEMDIIFIDMVFPHWYFGLIKNMFQSGKALKPYEIERITNLEQSKLALLNALLKRGE